MAEEQLDRLRDAFAHLLAKGQGGAVPAEAVWAAQGPRQFPPQASKGLLDLTEVPGDPTTVLPQRQINPDPEAYARQAMPSASRNDNPWLSTKPAPKPFHGKGEYVLPEKKKKEKKGKD